MPLSQAAIFANQNKRSKMPDKQIPNQDLWIYTNLNKDSTHPNPWKPPSLIDQFSAFYHNAYKIHKHPMENTLLIPNDDLNPLKEGAFTDRLLKATYKGFVIGKLFSREIFLIFYHMKK